jgi:cytosine/adenosine deaminase-related metal-dependent hydrolase
MRLAALLQKPQHGPKALPAQKAFDLATLGGAQALGMQDQLGSLETGKLADIVTVSREHPSLASVENPLSALVYSASGRDVENVMIDGKLVIENRKHFKWSHADIVSTAKMELQKLQKRSPLS